MLLIWTENKAIDRMLSISMGGNHKVNVDPTWTLKDLSLKTVLIKLGRRPLRPKPWRSFIISYFQVVGGNQKMNVNPTRILKDLSLTKLLIKLGRRPLRPKPWMSFVIPYFRNVSLAFSK